ncbi:RNA-binding protein 7 [Prorops nasuta]|uniref:RNA-binding protein 7 n=1 Tax=Prorops nasuta TaxID=863751 RepID=UPI0034CD9280
MDDGARTIYCGNISEKVSEELLYELFLQGGPVQKVHIPKDPNGKQRAFAFITYKHSDSVGYALNLFENTLLYNRVIQIQPRCNPEVSPQKQTNPTNPFAIESALQMGQQMLLGHSLSNLQFNSFNMYPTPALVTYPSQISDHPYMDDRRSRRMHPYHRDHDNKSDKSRDGRNDNRDDRRSDRYNDHRPYRSRDNHHKNNYSRNYIGNHRKQNYR